MLNVIGFVLINLSATAVASLYGWLGMVEYMLAIVMLALIYRALKMHSLKVKNR